MRKLWDEGLIQRILGLLILISLLGIAPRPHAVRRGFELARQAQSANSLQAAEELARLAEYLPWRGELWEEAGHYAMASDAPPEAIPYFTKALAADILSVSGYLALGDAYLLSDDIDSAIKTWETINEKFTPSEESLTRLAEAYLTKDDYDGTINILKELLDLQSSNLHPPTSNTQSPISNIYYDLGILLAAHQPESAPPYLLQAAERDPDVETLARELAFVIQRALPKDEPAYTFLVAGQKFAQHNQWAHAAHAFLRATQIRPDYAEAWAYLGEACQQIENPPPEAGFTELEHALALDPASLAANTFMALYWQRREDPQLAQEYLQTAADLDPHNATLQIHLGEMWARGGDLSTAQTFYEKAIELDPYDSASYQALAEFCIRYNLDLHEIALPAARQALSLAPNNPASLDVMGQILFRLGDYLNAERFYLQALENDERYPPTHLHLGLLYTLQDQPALARSHLSLAITLAPNTPTADHARRLMEDNLKTGD
ncbi:MAG: tetratricopeptide repeat protein [Anaerolineales bacterium]|nr:tetratricopeptide repeat protein [Chloroflexota bacterium]MBL7162209.1 tetratricopeptide repeat protein [Anaerolineales bacterium]